MIVTTQPNTVSRSDNLGVTTAFKMNASAQAFKILSSGLYSDKISAVLREIGCNAADSHTAAGKKQVPFEVKLPNQLDPLFYIKDFGIGLNDEGVRELFTTYFASSKSTSNDFTGAFGLGSKSPFSYVDSFTIHAEKDGTRRVYTAYISESGTPEVTLMHEEPSSGAYSGLSLGFPVKPEDVTEFHEKALNIFRYFTPQPNVLGLEVELETQPEYKLALDAVRIGDIAQEHSRIAVLMGNVLYPVSYTKLQLNDSALFKQKLELHENLTCKNSLHALLTQVTQAGVLLDLPIGAINVTASREQIEYDEISREALIAKLFDTLDQLAHYLNKVVTTSELSAWEVRLQAQELATSLSLAPDIIEDLWRLAELPFEQLAYFTETWLTLPKWLGTNEVRAKLCFASNTRDGVFKVQTANVLSGLEAKTGKPVVLPIRASTRVVVDDAPSALSRVKAFAGEVFGSSVYLILTASKTKQKQLSAVVSELQALHGNIPVMLASDLSLGPKPSVAAEISRKAVEAVQVTLKMFDYSQCNVHPDKVPEACRYFLVRNTKKEKTVHVSTPSTRPVPVNIVRNAFAALADALPFLPGFPVQGYIEVTPRLLASLKLEAQGFKPVIPEIVEQLGTNPWRDLIVTALNHGQYQSYYGEMGKLILRMVTESTVGKQILEETLVGHEIWDRVAKIQQLQTAGHPSITAFNYLKPNWSEFSNSDMFNKGLKGYPEEFREFEDYVRAVFPALAISLENSARYYTNALCAKTIVDCLVPVARALLLAAPTEANVV